MEKDTKEFLRKVLKFIGKTAQAVREETIKSFRPELKEGKKPEEILEVEAEIIEEEKK